MHVYLRTHSIWPADVPCNVQQFCVAPIRRGFDVAVVLQRQPEEKSPHAALSPNARGPCEFAEPRSSLTPQKYALLLSKDTAPFCAIGVKPMLDVYDLHGMMTMWVADGCPASLIVRHTVPAGAVVPNVLCNQTLERTFSLFCHSLTSAGRGQDSRLLLLVEWFVEFRTSGTRQ